MSSSPPPQVRTWTASWSFAILVSILLVVSLVARQVSAFLGTPENPIAYAFIFTVSYLFFIVVHELGHVVAGHLQKMYCSGIKVKHTVGVWLEKKDGSAKTCREQFLVSLAGPLAHMGLAALIAYSFILVGNLGSAVFLASMMAFMDGFLNLLLPMKRSDGGKAARALLRIIRGDGRTAFPVG